MSDMIMHLGGLSYISICKLARGLRATDEKLSSVYIKEMDLHYMSTSNITIQYLLEYSVYCSWMDVRWLVYNSINIAIVQLKLSKTSL